MNILIQNNIETYEDLLEYKKANNLTKKEFKKLHTTFKRRNIRIKIKRIRFLEQRMEIAEERIKSLENALSIILKKGRKI